MEATATLIARIRQWAQAGHTVVIHCIGGLGRTGTIAGCVLVDQGLEPKQVLAILRKVRGDPCIPETSEQREFIRRFAQWHNGKSAETPRA
jgi:protein-tyrosine phosphatase